MPTDDRLNLDPSLAPDKNLRLFWFQKYWALLGLALFTATWRLWTPQDAFPQIPFFELLTGVPPICDWIALSGTIVGLVLVLLKRQPTRLSDRTGFVCDLGNRVNFAQPTSFATLGLSIRYFCHRDEFMS